MTTPVAPTTDRTGPGASAATIGQIRALIIYQVVMVFALLWLLFFSWSRATPPVQQVVTADSTNRNAATAHPDSAAKRDSAAAKPVLGARTPAPTDSTALRGETTGVARPVRTADTVKGASSSTTADSSKRALVAVVDPKTANAKEQAVLFIVLAAGALGSLFRGLGSSTWYVGTRTLYRSWLAMYYVQPFKGAVLGLLFYFAFRTGLTSSNPAISSNPAGFAALAGLVGMFEREATKKLQLVAEALFTKKDETVDKAPASDPNAPGTTGAAPAPAPTAPATSRLVTPAITSTDPATIPAGTSGVRVKVRGTGFDPAAKVSVTSGVRPASRDVVPASVTPTDMYVPLEAADLASPGVVTLAVANGIQPGAKSQPFQITVK